MNYYDQQLQKYKNTIYRYLRKNRVLVVKNKHEYIAILFISKKNSAVVSIYDIQNKFISIYISFTLARRALRQINKKEINNAWKDNA